MSGTNFQYAEITGLVDAQSYFLVANMVSGASVSVGNLRVFYNGDTTDGNYNMVFCQINDSTFGGCRNVNTATVGFMSYYNQKGTLFLTYNCTVSGFTQSSCYELITYTSNSNCIYSYGEHERKSTSALSSIRVQGDNASCFASIKLNLYRIY